MCVSAILRCAVVVRSKQGLGFQIFPSDFQ